MEVRILALLLILFSTYCALAQKKIKPDKVCITQQEYEVYEAAGIQNYISETTTYPIPDSVAKQIPDISPDVIADFERQNTKTYSLRCVIKTDGKEKKLKRWGGATTYSGFSRIGFGKDEALLYYSWSAAGNYCGTEFIYLKKREGIWKIEERLPLVIC